MPTELEELVGFIASPNANIRLLATENLVPFSASQPALFKTDELTPIKHLKFLIRDHPKIAEHALTCLINLTAEKDVLEYVATDDRFLGILLGLLVEPDEVNANLMAMLLANLTKWDGLKSLLNRKQPAPEKLKSDDRVINQLMDLFVKGADGTYNKHADYDYLSYVFADLSKHEEIRHYFVNRQDYDDVIPINKIKVFTEHKSDIRRKGVASIIKNAAFDIPSHPAFLDEDDVNILPYILLPIMGGEVYPEDEALEMLTDLQLLPPDKQRDPDSSNILTHLETLTLLTTTRAGRDLMRSISVYPIVRETHLRVNDEAVQDACERLVNVLMRDEAEGEEIEGGAATAEEEDDIVEV
ncbi:uncharacterized protein B0T23DRAFT_431389 [Neurospora hispaniola]|uniref:Protein HGH1 homolog n=1 Tax=Neurospora hispaniola TaxID=588809 RepID=A0AAJ0I276_9PEZI|nr:hypothetical protein B0T23DRAFT_431389 [Neurospora hispaniola]